MRDDVDDAIRADLAAGQCPRCGGVGKVIKTHDEAGMLIEGGPLEVRCRWCHGTGTAKEGYCTSGRTSCARSLARRCNGNEGRH